MIVASVVITLVGVGLAGMGVLSGRGRLPRNSFAGVRTRASMRSEEAFRAANRVAAPLTVAGGAVLVLIGIVSAFLPTRAAAACILGGVVAAGALCVVGGVLGSAVAKRMTD